MLKTKYGESYDKWTRQYPGVSFNPAYFNSVIASAWSAFALVAPAAIRTAAEKCGYGADGLNPRADNYMKAHNTQVAFSGKAVEEEFLDSALDELKGDAEIKEFKPKVVELKARVSMGT